VNHSLADLCRALRVSASGYHAWLSREPSRRAQDDVRLAAIIAAIHYEHREAYGSRRLWRVLAQREVACGRHRMDRLRREHDLWTRRRRQASRIRIC
jgi:putative transposase